jgi:hypothetical protein
MRVDQNKHSTDFESSSPPTSLCVCKSIHHESISCSDFGAALVLSDPATRAVSGNYLEALQDFESALQQEPKNKDAKSEILRMKKCLGDATPIPEFDQ